MTGIVWSPQALVDLETIRDYIAHDSPRYAELVVRRLVVAVERLESFPQSGRIVPERNTEDIREIIVKPYRIVSASGSCRDRHGVQGVPSISGRSMMGARPNDACWTGML